MDRPVRWCRRVLRARWGQSDELELELELEELAPALEPDDPVSELDEPDEEPVSELDDPDEELSELDAPADEVSVEDSDEPLPAFELDDFDERASLR